MAQTNDEIRVSTEELIERLREIRVEQGLPPDTLPRPEVVSIPLSLALIERMKPFETIVIKYAAILAEGRTVRIDTDKLAQYAEYQRLLSYSKGTWCGWYSVGACMALQMIDHVNRAIDSGEEARLDVSDAMRRVHWAIKFMKRDTIRNDEYDYHDETGVYPKAEKERLLSDPDAFQAAIDEAIAQLHPKEEDDLHE